MTDGIKLTFDDDGVATQKQVEEKIKENWKSYQRAFMEGK